MKRDTMIILLVVGGLLFLERNNIKILLSDLTAARYGLPKPPAGITVQPGGSYNPGGTVSV